MDAHCGIDIGGGSGRVIFGMAMDPPGCVDTRGFLLVRGGVQSFGCVPGSPKTVGGGSAMARLWGNGGVTPGRSRVGASRQCWSDELDIGGASYSRGRPDYMHILDPYGGAKWRLEDQRWTPPASYMGWHGCMHRWACNEDAQCDLLARTVGCATQDTRLSVREGTAGRAVRGAKGCGTKEAGLESQCRMVSSGSKLLPKLPKVAGYGWQGF